MTLYANGLRARHHISAKNTFGILCAPAHKVRESRPPGSVRGVLSNAHPYRDSGCGEIVSMGAKRSKLIWTERRRCFPVVIAREVAALPAEWRQMR